MSEIGAVTRGIQVLGIDGHDGSGKTTLAKSLAVRLGGSYARPFAGEAGREFIAAGEAGEAARAIALGQAALERAVRQPGLQPPLVLDRSWVTVASVAPWDLFKQLWTDLIPTIVCWCDLETTLRRLSQRSEASANVAWHEQYIARYRELAGLAGCPLLRTDKLGEAEVLELAVTYADELLGH